MKPDYERNKALQIGSICVVIYLASYFFRNILSVFSPEMLATSLFTKERIALLSSTYMIVYAGGQLVNGVLGDYFKPKYMVCIGLCIAALGMLLFPLLQSPAMQTVCFALLGFGLSMLRGPLVKIISENSLPRYARVSCSLLSITAAVGPLIASLVSLYFQWRAVFTAAALISFVGAGIGFVLFTRMEQKKLIVPLQDSHAGRKKLDVLGVFRLPEFVRFLFLGMITEISLTSVGFWIPTYLNEHLHFAANTAGMIFSGMSLIKATAPFVCLLLLGFFGENCIRMMRSMFIASAVLMAIMYFVNMPWINVLLFTLSCTAASIASAALWSVYIPGLGKSGKVSSANGVLDCAGYIGAACANIIFAELITWQGWPAAIIMWTVIFIAGVAISIIPSKNATEHT